MRPGIEKLLYKYLESNGLLLKYYLKRKKRKREFRKIIACIVGHTLNSQYPSSDIWIHECYVALRAAILARLYIHAQSHTVEHMAHSFRGSSVRYRLEKGRRPFVQLQLNPMDRDITAVDIIIATAFGYSISTIFQ